jgi:hypothetical protein
MTSVELLKNALNGCSMVPPHVKQKEAIPIAYSSQLQFFQILSVSTDTL